MRAPEQLPGSGAGHKVGLATDACLERCELHPALVAIMAALATDNGGGWAPSASAGSETTMRVRPMPGVHALPSSLCLPLARCVSIVVSALMCLRRRLSVLCNSSPATCRNDPWGQRGLLCLLAVLLVLLLWRRPWLLRLLLQLALLRPLVAMLLRGIPTITAARKATQRAMHDNVKNNARACEPMQHRTAAGPCSLRQGRCPCDATFIDMMPILLFTWECVCAIPPSDPAHCGSESAGRAWYPSAIMCSCSISHDTGLATAFARVSSPFTLASSNSRRSRASCIQSSVAMPCDCDRWWSHRRRKRVREGTLQTPGSRA